MFNSKGLLKHLGMLYCPKCECYHRAQRQGSLDDPNAWIKASWESKELMALCLDRLSFDKVHSIINAEFVPTDPQSKLIKVRVTVQKGVLHQQSYVVGYALIHQLCVSCKIKPDPWVATVQLRQRVPHRLTFFYLEQLILKHDAASNAIKIKQVDQGIDFFFASRSHAVEFLEFLGTVAPVESREDTRFVNHDVMRGTRTFKFTISVEISPICRQDLICLPKQVSVSLGNLGPLVICTKVTNNIALLDPFTLRHCHLDSEQYWSSSFKSLLTCRELVEYKVLDVDIPSPPVEASFDGTSYLLANVQVARLSDLGRNDNKFFIKTYLGHHLKPGDHALGYDLYAVNSSDSELKKSEGLEGLTLPDAILIKKSYEEARQRKKGKPRFWKLESLNMEVEETSRGRDDQDKVTSEYEQFIWDLEESPDLRLNVSMYWNKDYQLSEMADDGEEVPFVALEELLADPELVKKKGKKKEC